MKGTPDMKRKNPEALTDDEVSLLRSDKTPAVIRQFTARQHHDIGLRTSAYRKVADAARAEREALMEVVMLEVTRRKAGIEQPGDPSRIFELEEQNRQLAAELSEANRVARAALAIPAMAVNSSD